MKSKVLFVVPSAWGTSTLLVSEEWALNDKWPMEIRFVTPFMSMPNWTRLPNSWEKFGPKIVPGSAKPFHDGKLVTMLFITGITPGAR